MKEGARREDGDGAIGVEGKEPDARHTIQMNISADVQLVHAAEAGHGWQKGREGANVPHRKRDDADPGRAVESINLEAMRNVWAERFFRDAPVHEEQLAPCLMHDGLTVRTLAYRQAVKLARFCFFHLIVKALSCTCQSTAEARRSSRCDETCSSSEAKVSVDLKSACIQAWLRRARRSGRITL